MAALNLRLLWFTEPFPTSALIVLFISYPILSYPLRQQRAFVTFCESNAKALLTACGHQKMLLRSPRVPGASFRRCVLILPEGHCPCYLSITPRQGAPFVKGSLASPLKPCVSVRVDGDGLFMTATGPENIVTTVTHRHAAQVSVQPAYPRDCVCSSTVFHTPATNARR